MHAHANVSNFNEGALPPIHIISINNLRVLGLYFLLCTLVFTFIFSFRLLYNAYFTNKSENEVDDEFIFYQQLDGSIYFLVRSTSPKKFNSRNLSTNIFNSRYISRFYETTTMVMSVCHSCVCIHA